MLRQYLHSTILYSVEGYYKSCAVEQYVKQYMKQCGSKVYIFFSAKLFSASHAVRLSIIDFSLTVTAKEGVKNETSASSAFPANT